MSSAKDMRTCVLKHLQAENGCTLAFLCEKTGYSTETVSNILKLFLKRKLIHEVRAIGTQPVFEIACYSNRVISIMITRTYVELATMGLSGEVISTYQLKLADRESPAQTLKRIQLEVQGIIGLSNEYNFRAICVTMPGPYIQEQGELMFITSLNGWEEVPVLKLFKESFDIPVFLENDANAGAFTQLKLHKDVPYGDTLAYIISGAGIGCGFTSAGQIQYGALGIAGEIGHMRISLDSIRCSCGNHGCLECYCSTIVLQENINRRIQAGEKSLLTTSHTLNDIAYAVEHGDSVASSEYIRCCKYLAIGIINVISILNPAIIIIGEGLAQIHPKMLLYIINQEIQSSLQNPIYGKTKIEVDTSPYSPILIGGGMIAARNVFTEDDIF